MGKTAILFPGQGSQEIGMGADLIGKYPLFESLVEMASDITGEDIADVCINGPDSKLIRPHLLQPLIVCVSLSYYEQLLEHGIKADYLAGHSLGEITALAAAKIVTYEEAIKIALKRGQLMDDIANTNNGGMMAVMFADIEVVKRALDEMNQPEKINLANNNAPAQVVLSGDLEALEQFSQKGIGRCLMVKVTGPWHSPYMESTKLHYQEWVKSINFQPPQIPIILNAATKVVRDPETIKQLHIEQLTDVVYWRESMEYLMHSGVDLLYEVGPGKVLKGLARANGFKKGSTVISINSIDNIKALYHETAIS